MTVGVRRGVDDGLQVRVGAGERVSTAHRALPGLLARYTHVRLRLEDPGLVLEPEVLEVLGDHIGRLTEVVIGATSFDLSNPIDAAGLRWLVNGCRAGVLDAESAIDPGASH